MYCKTYKTEKEMVVAICDKELIGKVFREGERVLDLKEYSSFYAGELTTKERASELLDGATSINLVGERAVSIAIEKKLADSGSVVSIEGVPHIQIYQLDI